MKVIDAQSAVRTNEDGLIVYAGSYTNIGALPLSLSIQTALRHRFYISLVADFNLGYGAIPLFDQQSIPLGYIETQNTNTELAYETIVPVGCKVNYLIIGTTT